MTLNLYFNGPRARVLKGEPIRTNITVLFGKAMVDGRLPCSKHAFRRGAMWPWRLATRLLVPSRSNPGAFEWDCGLFLGGELMITNRARSGNGWQMIDEEVQNFLGTRK